MSRVCLTGATGFVGRQICYHLLERGLPIRLIVRKGWEKKLSLETYLDADIELVETEDLFSEDVGWWSEVFDDVETIIHAAWYVEPGKYLTSRKNIDCLQGSLTMAKAAMDKSVKRFVGIGTCIEYKMSEATLETSSPFEVTTIYSAAKLSLYQTLSQLFKDSPVSFLWCRLFYLYGEGDDPRRFISFLHQKMQSGEKANLTSGTQIRDYMDVKLAGKRIVDLTFSDAKNGANICTGEGRTIREIAEGIADQYGRRDLLNFGARPDNLIDPARVVGKPSLPSEV